MSDKEYELNIDPHYSWATDLMYLNDDIGPEAALLSWARTFSKVSELLKKAAGAVNEYSMAIESVVDGRLRVSIAEDIGANLCEKGLLSEIPTPTTQQILDQIKQEAADIGVYDALSDVTVADLEDFWSGFDDGFYTYSRDEEDE